MNEVTAYAVYRSVANNKPKLMAFFTNELDAKYYADKCNNLAAKDDTTLKFYIEIMK